MRNLVIYLYPLLMDIVVALSLFVSRHSFAEKGMSVAMVGRIAIIYGTVYIASSLFMGRIIKPAYARLQMLIACGMIILHLCVLANVENSTAILALFAGLPFFANLFFNAFQAYMLDVDTDSKKSLSKSVGHYTFAWSLGFALGSPISTAAKNMMSWSAAYYTAAGITLVVGLIVLFFKPAKAGEKTEAAEAEARPADWHALPLAGWMGVFVCFSTWMCIATYWPVQSEALGFSTATKGWVEFSYAICQAIGAVIVCNFKSWYHRPAFLPLIALFGISGTIAFAFLNSASGFIAGASGVGFFAGCCFTYSVYHCMFDKELAVKRVAKNELTVGLTFIAGPSLAWLFADASGDFKSSYLKLAGFMVVGALVQLLLAITQSRRGKRA